MSDVKSRKRAMFLCPSRFEEGTYHRAFAFARYLVREAGYHVQLICTGSLPVEEDLDGVRVIQTAYAGPNPLPMRGFNVGEVLARRKIAFQSRERFDFVYSFEYQPNVWAVASPLVRRDRSIHFNDWCDWYAGRHHHMKGIRALQKIDAWLEEYPRTRVHCVTTICSSLYERALDCGVSADKLLMVREGAQVDGTIVSRTEARRQLGIPEDRFLIVSMADQGHEVLAKAIEQLSKKRSEVQLVIAGNVSDVPKNSPGLLLPGRVSNEQLHLWMCAADCAWLATPDVPVSRGRLPHKIGHFRMYGLPLVTTGVTDVIHLGDPGIRILPYDYEAFSDDALQRPLLTDDERGRLRRDAEGVFSWDKILAPLADRIERMIFDARS